MIITLTMKNPDCVEEAVKQALAENPDAPLGEIRDALEKWVKWDEYITIDIDTDKGTATVRPTN